MEKFQTLFPEPTYLPTLYNYDAINIIHVQLHRDLDRKQPRTQAPHLIVSGEPGDEARRKASQQKTVIASITYIYIYVCMYARTYICTYARTQTHSSNSSFQSGSRVASLMEVVSTLSTHPSFFQWTRSLCFTRWLSRCSWFRIPILQYGSLFPA